jgi:glutamate:GABA antiporter
MSKTADTDLLAGSSLPATSPLSSENYVLRALPPILTTRDLIALFVIILFFITNVPNAVAGGPAGLTLWLVGGLLFLIPCGIVTAQLAVMFPHEGSLYSWTHKAFGGFMSFFVGFCAWVPCSLLVLATADLAVSYLQGLNRKWLTEPWSQGLVLVGIVVLSCFVAVQRHRTVQTMVNLVFWLIMLATILVFLSGIVWLINRHPPATNFSHAADWNPFTAAIIPLFGVITLGYLGVNLPSNMGGELMASNDQARRRIITRHLLWGTLIVLVVYLMSTFGVLVVQGQNASFVLFSMVSTVDMALGPIAGNVTAICIIATLFIAAVVYNYAFARFLLVGGIDQRLPARMGNLNRNRVPASAIIFQTILTCILGVLFFIAIPYSGLFLGKPADLAADVYFVGVGAATVVWAFATVFLFIDLLWIYFKDRQALRARRVVPIPILLISSVVGLIAGLLAIVDTILNSYYPPLIPNSVWLYVVTGLTGAFLVVGAIGGMFARGEATWQGVEGNILAAGKQGQEENTTGRHPSVY